MKLRWIRHPFRSWRARKGLQKFEEILATNLKEMTAWDERDEVTLFHGQPWEVERPKTIERIEYLIEKFSLDLAQFDKQVAFLTLYLRFLHHKKAQLEKGEAGRL